jgi:hypothetical protein
MTASGNGYGRKQMITRSDIDMQTEGDNSMNSDHKSIRNKRYRQRNRSMVRDVGGFSLGVIRSAYCDFRMHHAVPGAEA